MTYPLRGTAIAAVAAASLTAAAAIKQAVIHALVLLVAAPSFVASGLVLHLIEGPSPWESAPLKHRHVISASVFLVVTFLWIAAVFSPLLFGSGFLGLSRARAQFVALVAAFAITIVCFYVMFSGLLLPK